MTRKIHKECRETVQVAVSLRVSHGGNGMRVMLAFAVPHAVSVACLILVVVIFLIGFLTDAWSEFHELFDGVREWWQDRHR